MAVSYNSNYDFTINFSDETVLFHLTNGTEQTYTVPKDAEEKYVVVFEYASDASVYVGLNSVISIPTADNSTETQFIEFKPDRRFVKGGDVLHFKTPDTTAYIGISLRSI